MAKRSTKKKGNLSEKIALGAAGVAAAAGAVAAGAALSDEQTRDKLAQAAKEAMDRTQSLATKTRDASEADAPRSVLHRLGLSKGRRKSQNR